MRLEHFYDPYTEYETVYGKARGVTVDVYRSPKTTCGKWVVNIYYQGRWAYDSIGGYCSWIRFATPELRQLLAEALDEFYAWLAKRRTQEND